MSKLNSNHGFISLLYSIGDNPLDLWSKHVSSEGRIRRIEDETLNGDRVIEISGPDNSSITTNISCPSSPIDCLNIILPVLVIILKNLKSNIRIDFQLIDEEDIRRKFVLSTRETSQKSRIVDRETARIFLKLEDDWNSLEIDLRYLCRSIYHTEYKALRRLIIHQNCRLRRIYLQDRHYEHNETPVQLCQAFFDMYMLKWGINFVEKSCQTNVTYANLNNDICESLSSTKTAISRKQHSAKSLSTEKPSSLQKILPSQGKGSSIGEAKRARRKKVFTGENRKLPNLGKIVSTPGGTEKIVANDDGNEGEIFREWPYNYLKFQQTGRNVTTKLKSNDPTNMSDRTNTINDETKFPISLDSLDRQLLKTNVPTLPVDVPISSEIERATSLENTKIVKSTRSKLLTTDDAVRDYLELRHVINRKILENFRSRGLTMTEVELSIYNTKNRRNSYGQGRLVEKPRTKIEKACDVITDDEATNSEKSAKK